MDLGLLIATALGTVAAIVAAVVAVVQAARAKSSEQDAVKARIDAEMARDESARLAGLATAAFIRSADAQEQSNALKEAEMKDPLWTGPRWVSGDVHRITNTSGRTVKLESIEVEPEEAERWVSITAGTADAVYKFGHSFDVMYTNKAPVSPRGLTIIWRYEDEPDGEPNHFIMPL